MPEFDTLEAAEKHYKKAIAEAEPDAVRGLELDLRETRADFRERANSARELETAKASVLAQYPRVKEFEDLVTGNSREEIEAKAKALDERFQRMFPEQQGEPANDAHSAYGPPTATNGSPASRAAQDDAKDKVRQTAARIQQGVRPSEQEARELVKAGGNNAMRGILLANAQAKGTAPRQ